MAHPQLDLITRFVAAAPERPLSPVLLDAAKQSLVDWFAVALAARSDPGPSIARRLMARWATHGHALNLYGDRGAAGAMALVNATLSHSLDYDDMHFATTFHASGPTWAATLAVGMDRGASERELLQAFVAGFEVGVTMGGHGLGPRLPDVGWHSTGVLGHLSSTCSAAALLRLPPAQIEQALGLAATQAAGLQASGGSMAKPFHVGKAAMNGVMAAELAALGMDANIGLFDQPQTGLMGTLFQKPTLGAFESLGQEWQLEGNTFKPYASCQLTHAAYEAARNLAGQFSREGLREIRVHVNPLAPKVAGRTSAATPMEGKFSIGYCVGLGLMGYDADMSGFAEARLQDQDVRRLSALTRVISSDAIERCGARIELHDDSGMVTQHEVTAVRGSLGSPMRWADLDEKFMSVTQPVLGAQAQVLLQALHAFEQPGQLAVVSRIIDGSRQDHNAEDSKEKR